MKTENFFACLLKKGIEKIERDVILSFLKEKEVTELIKEGLVEELCEVYCPECLADHIISSSEILPSEEKIECDVCGYTFLTEKTNTIKWIKLTRKGKGHFGKFVPYQFEAEKFEELDKEHLEELLNRVDKARNNKEKKESLENLARHLFSSIKGFRFIDKNIRASPTGEIDLMFKNNCPYLKDLGKILIIECKNWDRKVGKNELSTFKDKLSYKNVTTGIFIANNFSREAYKKIVEDFRVKKIKILPLKVDEIKSVIQNGRGLVFLLEQKYLELFKKA